MPLDNAMTPSQYAAHRRSARTAVNESVRNAVLSSNDGGCVYCSAPATRVDHVIPVACGGTSERDNLAPACKLCNIDKLDMTVDEWRAQRLTEGRSWPPRWTAEFDEELAAKGLLLSQIVAKHGPDIVDRLYESIRRASRSTND